MQVQCGFANEDPSPRSGVRKTCYHCTTIYCTGILNVSCYPQTVLTGILCILCIMRDNTCSSWNIPDTVTVFSDIEGVTGAQTKL